MVSVVRPQPQKFLPNIFKAPAADYLKVTQRIWEDGGVPVECGDSGGGEVRIATHMDARAAKPSI